MRKVTFLIVCLLASTASAQPPPALETIHVTQGLATYYRADGPPFATISVGDPSVMDANPLTDHAVLIQGYKPGTTNMLFFDSNKAPIKDVTVIVDAQGAGFVKIHNKALINSYTEFSCWKTGCQFRGENTVAEPAPLPRGYLNSTYNNGIPQQPQVIAPSNR